MDSDSVIFGQLLYGTLKRVTVLAGGGTNAQTIWAPAANQCIRLSSYTVEVSGQATLGAAGQTTVIISTPTVAISIHPMIVSNTALAGGVRTIFSRSFPGGLLLPLGETLSATMSVALSGGQINIHAFGREE